MSVCFCGSKLDFSKCCQLYILGSKNPDSAEQLMRSRYSAFCSNNTDYLMATSSISLRANLSKSDLEQTTNSCQFIKLEIIYADTNEVEFKADYILEHRHEQIHELSMFVQESGKWKYQSGEHFPTFSNLIKRNDVCPCGSGKKYKKCHL